VSVIALTSINLIGLKGSARMQNVLTLLEIGGVILVATAGLIVGHNGTVSSAPNVAEEPGAFGLAMVFVLLTYGGWNEAAYVSAEVRGGPRAMVRTLVLSILLITAAYLFFVIAMLYGLGFETARHSEAVGIQIMELAFGSAGAQAIGIIVAIAALTSMNSTMLVGARSNHAVARDWPAFAFMGQWRDERNIPVVGFLVQATIALALIAFGAIEKNGFSTMVEFTAPVFWFFFMLSGIALFVLRHKQPNVERPFKVPAYPLLPLIFVVTCAYLFYSSITYAQSQNASYVTLGVMISGALVWAAMVGAKRMADRG
jgi:amino acid transporter